MTDLISQYISLKSLDKPVQIIMPGFLTLEDLVGSHMKLLASEFVSPSPTGIYQLNSMPDEDTEHEWNITAPRRAGKTTYLISRVRKILLEEKGVQIIWLCQSNTPLQAAMERLRREFMRDSSISVRRSIAYCGSNNTCLDMMSVSSLVPSVEPNVRNLKARNLVVVVDDSFTMPFDNFISKLGHMIYADQPFRLLTAGTGDVNYNNLGTVVANCEKVFRARVHHEGYEEPENAFRMI